MHAHRTIAIKAPIRHQARRTRAALRALAPLAWLIALPWLTCCMPDFGDALVNGEVLEGQPACLQKALPMSTEFRTIRQEQGQTTITLASVPRSIEHADALHVQFDDAILAAGIPAGPRSLEVTTGPFGDDEAWKAALDPAPRARARLLLGQSCPELTRAFVVRGDLFVDAMANGPGDRTRGRIVNAALLDAITGEVVVSPMDVHWSFERRHGPPFDFFPSYEP